MSQARVIPTAFLSIYSCDPLSGAVTRTIPGGRWPAGHVLRTYEKTDKGGKTYAYFQIEKSFWAAHRIIWFLCTGQQPPAILDHRNNISTDNRFANLRPATRSQNSANSCGQSTRGLPKGVRLNKSGTYYATITANGRHIYLGTFETIGEAHQAYVAAAKLHFGEFARAA